MMSDHTNQEEKRMNEPGPLTTRYTCTKKGCARHCVVLATSDARPTAAAEAMLACMGKGKPLVEVLPPVPDRPRGREKAPDQMSLEEFKAWAVPVVVNALITRGFDGVAQAMSRVLMQASMNSTWGGAR